MEWLKGLVGRRRQEEPEREAAPEASPAAALMTPELESAKSRAERWRSVYIIYFTMFHMSLGFSIVLTGVYPYLDKSTDKMTDEVRHNCSVAIGRVCWRQPPTDGDGCSCTCCWQVPLVCMNEYLGKSAPDPAVTGRDYQLEPGSKKEILGIAVGAHPLGQLLFSPLFGLWANRAKSARAPLLASLLLFVIASLLYSSLHLTRPHATYWMVFARFLVGISSGNIAVARSYLSAATLVSERTRAVAGVSLAQVLGFIVGPAIQAAAALLGPGQPYPPPGEYASLLRFDMYTAAGWINALLGIINFVLFLPWCFKERKIAAREAMVAQGKNSEKEALKALKPDYISSWTLITAFFVLVFNFVLLETLATSLTMDQFAWSKKEALEYMGALMSAGAVVACATFAIISPLTKVFEERALLLWGGFLLTGMASVFCIPWGPGPPPLAPLNATEAGGGCPQLAQPWCEHSRGINIAQFLMGYACVSVGYPLGVTLIQTIFSKVLGPRPQGVWMGILTGAGCLSRALGPVFMSAVYGRSGPDATFGSTAGLTFAALLGLRLVYNRLKPPDLTPVQEMRPLQDMKKEEKRDLET